MTNRIEELSEEWIGGPFMRAGPLNEDLSPPRDVPQTAVRDGRAAPRGAPFEAYYTYGERWVPAALIEMVRGPARQAPRSSWPSLPAEMFEQLLRLTVFLPLNMHAVDTTTRRAHARFHLPDSIVGDAGGPRQFRPYQRMIAAIRKDWSGPILMDSATLNGATTLVLPRPLVVSLTPAPGQTRARMLPPEIIEHALGRQQLSDDYDIDLAS